MRITFGTISDSRDYTTSIEELAHALDDLVKRGKVIYLGVSDTPAWIVSQFNQYAKDHVRLFS
jgi:aryl-alcohol dehydrogenase-like predicted oxidoreductase